MMDYEPQPRPVSWQVIRQKVIVPGIFLAVVGALNLIIGGILIVSAVQMQRLPEDEFKKAFEEGQQNWSEKQKEGWRELQRQGWTLEKLREMLIQGMRAWGIAAAVVGLVGLFGGIRMAMLRSYGLAIFGAILTAVPILSPCCLLGQIVGIWALVVLFSSGVKGAFDTKGAPPPPPEEGMLR